MTSPVVPFDRYPGLPRLYRGFRAGRPELYPDSPDLDSAERRARELLGRIPRLPTSAFRSRGEEAARLADALAAGRAVAVVTGHQVGLFTGPLFTLLKALDAIRVARELTRRGVPAAPVFWALTDDHDLEEVARTAKPSREGPERLVLEGADRSNRGPVGTLPLPGRISEILDSFRADARSEEARATLEGFAGRYAPSRAYGEAFVESLFDLVHPDPLLVLDPLAEEMRAPSAEFFTRAFERRGQIEETLAAAAARVESLGFEPAVPHRPGVFPFFVIAEGQRRRIEDVEAAAKEIAAGSALASTDVLTRPVFKSWLLPVAASVLGPAEIAYHAQALALFTVLAPSRPVLLPRSHVVPRGPAERRAAEALGLSDVELLSLPPEKTKGEVPGLGDLDKRRRETDERLGTLEPVLESLDPTLLGALETTRRKVAYQFEQLSERMRKAAERKDQTVMDRGRRLETMLLPFGEPAERVYPPLVWLLAYGREAVEAFRRAGGVRDGAVIVDLGGESAAPGAEGEADGR